MRTPAEAARPAASLADRVRARIVAGLHLRAVRTGLRDAWWAVRGLAIRNPTLPTAPRSLLFVCKGNICRSPFAAHLATQWLAGAGRTDVRCLSAGFRVSHETRTPLQAIEAAARFGVSLEAHRSTALDLALVESSDAVVVMEASHMNLLREQYLRTRNRIYLLPLFSLGPARLGRYSRYTIADPYGQSAMVFDQCYERIAESLEGLLQEMFGGSSWRRA